MDPENRADFLLARLSNSAFGTQDAVVILIGSQVVPETFDRFLIQKVVKYQKAVPFIPGQFSFAQRPIVAVGSLAVDNRVLALETLCRALEAGGIKVVSTIVPFRTSFFYTREW